MNLIKKVRKTIRDHRLFDAGDKVLVAVSGGPDSVFLLHALMKFRHDLGIDFCVVHFNHQLRKDSKKDEYFVKTLAKTLQLPCITTARPVLKNVSSGSIEEIARQARFNFFAATAKKINADKIALGHTQDDLAETVLMRILRGTGLYGLQAIYPKRTIKGLTFVRPLLDIPKHPIITFLKAKKIKYRIDPSNKKTDFFRNKIRLKLLPTLQKNYNPNISATLANLAHTVSADYEFLNQHASQTLKKVISFHQKHKITVSLSKFNSLHQSLQRMTLRFLFEKLKGDTRGLTFEHVLALKKLAGHACENSQVHLPHKITVCKEGGCLVFSRRNS